MYLSIEIDHNNTMTRVRFPRDLSCYLFANVQIFFLYSDLLTVKQDFSKFKTY